MTFRVAADIGGTFTDLVLVGEDGEVSVEKTPSTPPDFTPGILLGVKRVLANVGGVTLGEVETFVHGATVVLNALLQRRLPKTALITTLGFRDVLEIMRTNNPEMYDLHYIKPVPVVPRRLRLEVEERVRHTGEILVPVAEDDVRRAGLALRQEGVEAIGVCLLHAYANPSHERRVRDMLEEMLPGCVVCISSDVAPEWREFQRTATTCLNAATIPIITSYLDGLSERLKAGGLKRELQVMQSNGGVMTSQAACRWPVRTIMSGPSGGVVGALYLAEEISRPNVVTIDIGGTSSDMGLIAEGKAASVVESTITEGWPILAPMIEIVSIGAGGGSIAWLDVGSAIRVGPQSAGADPGPACYGRGGLEPTVTDANLSLGRIDPNFFLGGEMALHLEMAERAIAVAVADPLGLDVNGAAAGIVTIINTNMARAMRSILVERGYDPRDFTLMAFGGAGGLHAGALIRELNIPRAVVPNNPGALSAFGMLATDFRHDRSRTFVEALADLDAEQIELIFEQLEDEVLEALTDEGVRKKDREVHRSVDLRYVGQEYHLNISLGDPRARVDPSWLAQAFNTAHERVYGYATPEFAVQLVNLRVTGIGRIDRPRLPRFEAQSERSGAPKSGGVRSVYFEETGFADTEIYYVEALRYGDRLQGPVIIEDPRSTVVVLPGQAAVIDEMRNIFISHSDARPTASKTGGW